MGRMMILFSLCLYIALAGNIFSFLFVFIELKISDGERYSAQCKIYTYQPFREEVYQGF